jgi:hypothetical protein
MLQRTRTGLDWQREDLFKQQKRTRRRKRVILKVVVVVVVVRMKAVLRARIAIISTWNYRRHQIHQRLGRAGRGRQHHWWWKQEQ